MSLTIDENLMLRGFARGISSEQPFHYNSVPFNWLSYETQPEPAPEVVKMPEPDDEALAEVMNGVEAGTVVFREELSPENGIPAEMMVLPDWREAPRDETIPLAADEALAELIEGVADEAEESPYNVGLLPELEQETSMLAVMMGAVGPDETLNG